MYNIKRFKVFLIPEEKKKKKLLGDCWISQNWIAATEWELLLQEHYTVFF